MCERFWTAPRLIETLAAHHDGPGHSSDFVGERDSGDFDRSASPQANEPEPFRAVLSRISDNGHGTCDQQPSQMSIALL
jgi:hypothetical protein